MEGFATALGEAIRAARTSAGLSQRKLERRSGGRLRPSTVGGYERGERDISVERFVRLAYALGVPPEDLLADALRRASPRTHREISVDLAELEREAGAAAAAIAGWARRTQVRRDEFFHDVITLRSGDVEVIAAEANMDVSTLLREIDHALHGVGPDG